LAVRAPEGIVARHVIPTSEAVARKFAEELATPEKVAELEEMLTAEEAVVHAVEARVEGDKFVALSDSEPIELAPPAKPRKAKPVT
jgi:hypothetical protein